MLGKLIKYELKATGRKIAPLYAALICIAIIVNLFIGNIGNNSEFSGGIVQIISIFAYGSTMAAVFIITLYITLQRFYKNLLGREGYLMNTLPVPTWMNISNKLIVSVIWNIVSFIIAILSLIIISFSKELFIDGFFTIDLDFLNINGYFIKTILYVFISIMVSTLTMYLSMAVGHLFNKRRVLLSFIAYIAITIVVSIIKNIANVSLYMPNTLSLTPKMGGLIIFDLFLGVILFIGCNYIIKNKLNLE